MENKEMPDNSSDLSPNQDKPETNKPNQKKTFLQNSFQKIGYALLFLLIGALIVTVVLYLPTDATLKTTQAEVKRLQPIETEYAALVSEHELVSARSGIYKTLSDTSMLNVALASNDANRIDQYIKYVEEDLKNLMVPNFPDLPSSLTSQFVKVTSSVSTNRAEAITELQKFQNDLLSAADNLE